MKIKKVIIENFRGIKDLQLDFYLNKPTIFIGINGSGKSTILDALAILLSPFFARLINQDAYGSILKEEDINNHSSDTRLEITVSDDHNQEKKWSIFKSKLPLAATKNNDLTTVEELAKNIQEKLKLDNNNNNINIPLAVHYLTNRAVLDIPLRIKKRHSFIDQFEAYDNALIGSETDFRIFFEWFREKEDLENEVRLDSNPNYRDPQLEAVRHSISCLMPDFTNLKVKRSPLRMVLHKKGEELIINQLSDGEKCLLAMVGDLARRLAIANPSLESPLEGNAIVLIDEIELHLHPKWQREIITKLRETFPNCQFIVTTHSPQVISHVDSVYLIDKENEEISLSELSSYGRDSNYILEVFMDTKERPPEVQDKILQIFRLIEEEKFTEVKRLRQELTERMDTEDPILLKVDFLMKTREILNR